MQAAAVRERDRIAEVVAQDAAEHVEKARTRAAAEAEELSRLAEADVARIKDWSKTEIERIRRDADRRTDERRKSLEVFLAKHESIIVDRDRRRRRGHPPLPGGAGPVLR